MDQAAEIATRLLAGPDRRVSLREVFRLVPLRAILLYWPDVPRNTHGIARVLREIEHAEWKVN